MNKITEDLQNEVQWELENNILPFWMNRMIDSEYGGFHGQITGNNQRVVHAPKGAILNARILWTGFLTGHINCWLLIGRSTMIPTFS